MTGVGVFTLRVRSGVERSVTSGSGGPDPTKLSDYRHGWLAREVPRARVHLGIDGEPPATRPACPASPAWEPSPDPDPGPPWCQGWEFLGIPWTPDFNVESQNLWMESQIWRQNTRFCGQNGKYLWKISIHFNVLHVHGKVHWRNPKLKSLNLMAVLYHHSLTHSLTHLYEGIRAHSILCRIRGQRSPVVL